MPLPPHACGIVPVTHLLPFVSQQPPLHSCCCEQAVTHPPVIVSHAMLSGQSVGTLQPASAASTTLDASLASVVLESWPPDESATLLSLVVLVSGLLPVSELELVSLALESGTAVVESSPPHAMSEETQPTRTKERMEDRMTPPYTNMPCQVDSPLGRPT